MKPKRSGRYLNAQPGWHEVGGRRIYFRSKMELHHAQRLEMLRCAGVIEAWEHEPKRFDFPCRGANSYKPDFRVSYRDGRVEWHETKGWLDPKSMTQLCRMARYYPSEDVRIIGKVTREQLARIEKARELGRRKTKTEPDVG